MEPVIVVVGSDDSDDIDDADAEAADAEVDDIKAVALANEPALLDMGLLGLNIAYRLVLVVGIGTRINGWDLSHLRAAYVASFYQHLTLHSD